MLHYSCSLKLTQSLTMNRKRFFKIFMIEFLIVLLVAAYFLIDSSDVYKWWVGDTSFVTCKADCDLHQEACTVILSDGNPLTFEINPKPIGVMKPLTLSLKTTNIQVPFIEVKLFATNMNMGFHSFKLLKKEDGFYEGVAMLPTCVVGNMIWQANIIINNTTQSIGAIYTFQTK